MTINGKTILITGGTGSLGQALARRLLADHDPAKVIIFSRDEWKQWEMQKSDPLFDHPKIRYFLGDVRDKDRLYRAFHGVDLIVHAAALKQIPKAEYNPCEFVKTNVIGAMNIIDAAIDCGVSKVIALSTDKAVNPVNLYGATKLCSDKLFVAAGAYVGDRPGPLFSVVRYGNVLGSRGSAVPLWKKMAEEGAAEIPITDERMTRFWISVDQAVDFVLDSFERMEGGEIFVPKMPSMKILDLAEAIAPGIPKKIIGIREGEKLHEHLISPADSGPTYEFETHFTLPTGELKGGKLLPRDFVYASDKNTEWLHSSDLEGVVT